MSVKIGPALWTQAKVSKKNLPLLLVLENGPRVSCLICMLSSFCFLILELEKLQFVSYMPFSNAISREAVDTQQYTVSAVFP